MRAAIITTLILLILLQFDWLHHRSDASGLSPSETDLGLAVAGEAAFD